MGRSLIPAQLDRHCFASMPTRRLDRGHPRRVIARHERLQVEHQYTDQRQRRDDLRDARAEISRITTVRSFPNELLRNA